jgi:ribosome-binding factor A
LELAVLKMESKRQMQVGELVLRNFSIVLREEGGYIYGNKILVSITQVKMSPDMAIAKIYLSVFNTEDKQEPVTLIENEYPRLRQILGQRIRKHVRIIPQLQFFLDDTIDEMFRVQGMFDRLYEDNQMGTAEVEKVD